MWTRIVFLLIWFLASSNGQAENHCGTDNGGCKFLCVPAPGQPGQMPFTCECPTGMTLHPHDPRDCVQEFPRPEPLEALVVSPTAVELQWSSPLRLPALPLEGFRLHVMEGPAGRWTIIALPPHQLRFRLSELLPATQYNVTVEALYPNGAGATAAPVTVQTPGRSVLPAVSPATRSAASATVPGVANSTTRSVEKSLIPSRVRKIRVTTLNETSLQVSWLPPRNYDQVEIVGYRIQVTPVRAAKQGDARAGREEVEVGGTEAVVVGLQAGTRYRLTVIPLTSTDPGTPRSMLMSTTGLVPATRVYVSAVPLAGDAVLVRWGVGGTSDHPKASFSVYFRALRNSSWTQWTALPHDRTARTAVLRTEESSSYEFLVQARVQGRPVPLTSLTSLLQFHPEILPPEDINVQVTDGGRLLVRWEPRVHRDVIGYVIKVLEVDSNDVPRGQARSHAVLGNQTQQELAVERGHRYRLQMAALTFRGASGTSRPVYFRVPAASQPFVRGELRGSEVNSSTSIRNREENDEEETERAPPVIVQPFPPQRDVTEGAAFTFTCRVRSVLGPNIQWIRRVNELAEDRERKDETTFEIEGQLFAMLPATSAERGEDGLYVSSYVITEATPRDAGMYVCVTTNSRGYTVKDTYLSVLPEEQYSPAVVPPYPRDVMVKAGDSVSFTCRIESQTKPKIKWLRNVGAGGADSEEVEGRYFAELPSQRLGREQGVYVQRLELDEVYEEDAGLYLCMATNAAGSAYRTASLVVTPGKTRPFLPVFLAPYPQNLTAKEGDTVSFTCRVKSDGKPVMQWLKSVDDEEATLLNASSRLQLGGQTFQPLKVEMTQAWDGAYVSRLTLSDVAARDAATYICLASNVQGYRFRAGSLTVEKPDKIGFSPPKFLEPLPRNSTVLVGTSVRLFCRVSSVLEPSIKWIRTVPAAFASQFDTYEEGGQLYTGVAASPSRPGPEGVLVSRVDIPSAQPNHAGTYVCLATNAAGLVKLRVSLDVVQPEASEAEIPMPEMTPSPPGSEAPKFSHSLERDVTVSEGSSLLLLCSFTSSDALPPPRVQWLVETANPGTAQGSQDSRKPLGEGELLPVSPGSYVNRFLMTPPVDVGKYQCVVENAAGSATATINVTFTPGAASEPGSQDWALAVHVLERQADRLLVGWRLPPLPSVDYFSLDLSSPALPRSRTITPLGSDLRQWLYQLQPDTDYSLNLTAHACSGQILAWGTLQTRTLVADMPLLLVTTDLGQGGLLRVSWRGWSLPMVNGFQVALQRPFDPYTRRVATRPEEDSVWLGVVPGTTYVVTVSALSTSEVVIAEASVNVTTPFNFSTGSDVTTARYDSTGSYVTSEPYAYTSHSHAEPLEELTYVLPDTQTQEGVYLIEAGPGQGEVVPTLRGREGQTLDVQIQWRDSRRGVLRTEPGQAYFLSVPKGGNVFWNNPGLPLPMFPVRELALTYHVARLNSNPFVNTVYIVVAAYNDTTVSVDMRGGGSPVNWSVELDSLGQTSVDTKLGPGTIVSSKPVALFLQSRPKAMSQSPGIASSLIQNQQPPLLDPVSPGVEGTHTSPLPASPTSPLPPRFTSESPGSEGEGDASMPQFLIPSFNVTVKTGQTAILPCSINSLGRYRVSWTDKGDNLLTYRERRLTPDRRFSLQHPFVTVWNLVLHDVTPDDQGLYRCTVNAEPPLVLAQRLVVTEAEEEEEEEEEGGRPAFLGVAEIIAVREGDTATLPCSVRNLGDRKVSWISSKLQTLTSQRRRYTDDPRFSVVNSDPLSWNLRIDDVTNYDEGLYYCSVNTDPRLIMGLQLVVHKRI